MRGYLTLKYFLLTWQHNYIPLYCYRVRWRLMWMFELHFISVIYARDLWSNLRDKLASASGVVTGARTGNVWQVWHGASVCVNYDHNDLCWHIITMGIQGCCCCCTKGTYADFFSNLKCNWYFASTRHDPWPRLSVFYGIEGVTFVGFVSRIHHISHQFYSNSRAEGAGRHTLCLIRKNLDRAKNILT